MILIVVACPAAHADDVTVTVTLTPQGQQLAQGLGDSPDMLIQKVKTKIDDYYQVARVGQILREFVDATSFVNRDLGVDYAVRPGDIVFGVVGDAALAADGQLTSTGHVTAGTAINFAVIAGANLARWGAPRWSIYGNGFYESGQLDELDGHLTSAGAHVQYRAITPAPGAWWIGLDLTSGLELTRWTLGAARPIDTRFTVQGTSAGTSRNLTLTSIGTLTLVADTLTIPIEASTGVRLGPLALYCGGGVDVSVGSSTLEAMLAGDMTITSDGTNVGHVVIDGRGSSSPSPLAVRGLAGFQLDVPHASLFVQANAASAATAVSVGLRAVL